MKTMMIRPTRLYSRRLLAACALIGRALVASLPALAQSPTLPTEIVPADPTRPILDLVEEYFNALDTLAARFTQRGPDGSLSGGKLYLDRPGRVRFDYGEETPLLIVADGKILTFVDYDIGQVTRWPINDTPLAPLLGEQVDIRSAFEIVESGPGALPDRIIVAARDPEKPEQGEITLYFADQGNRRNGSDLSLLGWTVRDAQGLLTTITLSDVEQNPTLTEALWAFKDPRAAPAQRRRRR